MFHASIRQPAAAGSFYPEASAELAATVDALLEAASAPVLGRPKGLIVPHAGYVYSGPIAASAYAALKTMNPKPTRVVLLGPSHHVGFSGLALPGVDALQTPLGVVQLDRDVVQALVERMGVLQSPMAHAREHSLEVQLPFLQRVLGEFQIVPLVVGRATVDEMAAVIEFLWGGAETLFVVSTDLSHYLPYREAVAADAKTVERIVGYELNQIDPDCACGACPLRGFLAAAAEHRLKVVPLDIRNSADTAGSKDRVVGYGSFALVETGVS